MPGPTELRAEARALYSQARSSAYSDDALLYVLHAVECEVEADDLEEAEPAPGARRGLAGIGHNSARPEPR